MREILYRVLRVDGEYALLRDEESREKLPVALALLPPGTDENSRLLFRDFSYELPED